MANTDVPVYSLNAPSFVPSVSFSDHQNYWRFNYDAVMITDTAHLRNPHYHSHSDKAETLNYAKMAEVLKALYEAVRRINN